jgi:hypothetical protein
MDFHRAKSTDSRGLHGTVVAEGGNVDTVLPVYLQNGPAIFTADFKVIYDEIDPPASPFKKKYEIMFLSFFCSDKILSEYNQLSNNIPKSALSLSFD